MIPDHVLRLVAAHPRHLALAAAGYMAVMLALLAAYAVFS